MIFLWKYLTNKLHGIIAWQPGLGIAAVMLTACTPPEPVRIGLVGELSGSNTGFGLAGRNGAMLAVEEQNSQGGINGRMIKLEVIDYRLEGNKSLDKLTEHGVQAVIAPLVSQACAALADDAERLKQLLICTISTAPELIGRDDMVFRLAASVQKHATTDADFLLGTLRRQSFAIAYDLRNRLYAQRYAEELQRIFADQGIKTIKLFPYATLNGGESATLIKQMQASGADTFIFASNPLDAARLAQHSRQLAAAVMLFGAAWAGGSELPQLGGKAVEGMYVGQFFRRSDNSPRFVAFRQAYQKRFNEAPGFTSVGGYDAARILIDSIRRKSSQQTLKTALLQLGPYQGLQQEIRFDRFGDSDGLSGIAIILQGELQGIK